MKLLLIIFSLVIASCSSNDDAHLKLQITQLNDQLLSCKSSLEVYRNPLESNTSSQTEEKSCAETTYNEIYIDGRLVDTCTDESTELAECGLKAQECNSGKQYYCLHNVTIKSLTKEECN